MNLYSPQSLKKEHENLHLNLARVIALGGKTGDKARSIAQLLHPHFIKEEKYAIPPLSLLLPLAKNETIDEMKQVLSLTQKLKEDWDKMLEEHKVIVTALGELMEIALNEKHPEAISFAESLILHTQNEEEVLYPASILVGEYIQLILK